MADALAEYNLRVSDKSSPWGSLSEEQEEILLLKAEIKRVTADSSKKKSKKNQRTSKKNAGQGAESAEASRDASGNFKIPPWKLDPPKEGDKTKEVNGKTYYWCPHHYDGGMWALHQPKDCNNRNNERGNDNQDNEEQVNVNMAEESDDPEDEEVQVSLAILAHDSDDE